MLDRFDVMVIRSTIVAASLALLCPAAPGAEPAGLGSIRFFSAPLDADGNPVVPAAPTARDAGRPTPANPVAAARPALSQDETDRLTAEVDRRLAAIEAEETANGVRSPALIDELAALADVYRQLGEYLFAITALNDAVQIYRISNGLYAFDQVELVEDMVENQIVLGEFEEAAYWQNYTAELAHRSPDDPRVAGIFATIAEQQMDRAAFELERGPEPVISVAITSPYAPPPASDGPPPGPDMARMLIRQARWNYQRALQSASRSGAAVLELFDLGNRVIDTYYYELLQPEFAPDRPAPSLQYGPDGSTAFTAFDGLDRARWAARDPVLGSMGQAALERKVNNAMSFLGPLDAALALIELGDWNLLFDRNGVALDNYGAAHDFLQSVGLPDATISELFSPAAPVALPAFGPTVQVYDPRREYDGYVDVSIKVNRYGQSKHIDVLAASSADDSKPIERRLKRHIARTHYRPRFVDGEPARSDRFTLRYYYLY